MMTLFWPLWVFAQLRCNQFAHTLFIALRNGILLYIQIFFTGALLACRPMAPIALRARTVDIRRMQKRNQQLLGEQERYELLRNGIKWLMA